MDQTMSKAESLQRTYSQGQGHQLTGS